LFAEHGLVVARGISHVRRLLVDNLADPERNGLSDFFVETLIEMAERLRFLDEPPSGSREGLFYFGFLS
jgi:hypothetical protein